MNNYITTHYDSKSMGYQSKDHREDNMTPRRSGIDDLGLEEDLLFEADAEEKPWTPEDDTGFTSNTPGKVTSTPPAAYVVRGNFELTGHHRRDQTKGLRTFTIFAPASKEIGKTTYLRLATPKVFLGSIAGASLSFLASVFALKNGFDPTDVVPIAGIAVLGSPYVFLRRAEHKGWSKHFYYEIKPFDGFYDELEANWKSILHQISLCVDKANNLVLTSTDSDANHDELIQVRQQVSEIAWDAAGKTEKFLNTLAGVSGLSKTHFPGYLPLVYAKMVDSLNTCEALVNTVSEIEVRSELWFHEESPTVTQTQADLVNRLSGLMKAQNALGSGDLPSTEDLNRTPPMQ